MIPDKAAKFTVAQIDCAIKQVNKQDAFLDENDYLGGYWALRTLFDKKLNFDNVIDVEIGVYAVYGWMPTIPKPISSSAREPLCRFAKKWKNSVDAKQAIKAAQQIGLRFVNNSVVGTSKFLHFLAPEIFPIWDSRIARVFNLRYDYQINNAANYVAYFELMHQRLMHPITWPAFIQNNSETKLTEDMSNIRKLEFCLFQHGKTLANSPTHSFPVTSPAP